MGQVGGKLLRACVVTARLPSKARCLELCNKSCVDPCSSLEKQDAANSYIWLYNDHQHKPALNSEAVHWYSQGCLTKTPRHQQETIEDLSSNDSM